MILYKSKNNKEKVQVAILVKPMYFILILYVKYKIKFDKIKKVALYIMVPLQATSRGDVMKYAFIRVAYNPISAKSGEKTFSYFFRAVIGSISPTRT